MRRSLGGDHGLTSRCPHCAQNTAWGRLISWQREQRRDERRVEVARKTITATAAMHTKRSSLSATKLHQS